MHRDLNTKHGTFSWISTFQVPQKALSKIRRKLEWDGVVSCCFARIVNQCESSCQKVWCSYIWVTSDGCKFEQRWGFCGCGCLLPLGIVVRNRHFLELFESVEDVLTKMLPFHHFSPNGRLIFIFHLFLRWFGGCQFLWSVEFLKRQMSWGLSSHLSTQDISSFWHLFLMGI